MKYHKLINLLIIIILFSTIIEAQTNKIYILNLNYDNGKITLKDKIIKYGYYPDRKIQEEGYRAEIIATNDDILYFFNFEIPLKVYVDVTSQKGELSGGVIKLDKTDFALILPYFKEAKEIRFYDENNNKVFSIDVEEKLSKKKAIWLWAIPVVFIIIFLIFLYRKFRK